MKGEQAKVLLIGFGNPGRLDDGLGPALAAEIEKLGLPGVTVDSDYQLTLEDSAEAARHDVVIFADAAVSGPEPFEFRKIEPGGEMSFSSHDCDPPAVLSLTRRLFGAKTDGYVLAIRGYEFNEFGERLSARAVENLRRATDFMADVVRTGEWPATPACDEMGVTADASAAIEDQT